MNHKLSIKLIAALIASLAALPSQATNHALILGISAYPTAPLPGVVKDVENATEIAKIMGVSSQNIVVKKDQELTVDNLPRIISEFSSRVKSGDRVFVYFSGHGTSYSSRSRQGQCEQALLTYESKLFNKDQFHQLINQLSLKTDKTVVMLDSCFSGGLVQASHAKDASRAFDDMPRAKFNSSTPEDPCAQPSNFISKGSRDFGIAAANQTANYYLLAASGEAELAIDGGPVRGSYATTSILNCMQNPAQADRNRDGVVSMDEVRLCAQQRVDEMLSSGRQRTPNFPFTAMTLTQGYGPGGNAAISFVGGRQQINSSSFAQTLFDARDASRNVALRADKNPIRLGDNLNLELVSDRSGYLTLMVVGSSGKIYQIFPNDLDREARVEAGRPLPIPRPGRWMMPATPPTGDNYFLALVSDTPDRFKGLGEQAGIFKGFGDTAEGAKGIVERIINPASDCGRDFGIQKPGEANPCSTSYGAALIKVVIN